MVSQGAGRGARGAGCGARGAGRYAMILPPHRNPVLDYTAEQRQVVRGPPAPAQLHRQPIVPGPAQRRARHHLLVDDLQLAKKEGADKRWAQGSGFRAWGLGLEFKVLGLGSRFWVFVCGVLGLRFRIQDLGF